MPKSQSVVHNKACTTFDFSELRNWCNTWLPILNGDSKAIIDRGIAKTSQTKWESIEN